MISEGGAILTPPMKYHIGYGAYLEVGVDVFAPWPTENIYAVVELRKVADDKLLQRVPFFWHRDDYFTMEMQYTFDAAWDLCVRNFMATARGLTA